MTAERALHELQLDMRSQIEKYDQLQEARRSVPDQNCWYKFALVLKGFSSWLSKHVQWQQQDPAMLHRRRCGYSQLWQNAIHMC